MDRVRSRRRRIAAAAWSAAPDRLAGEIGSYIPFPLTRAERARTNDPRLSIEERYRNRDEYVGKYAAATLDLVAKGYVLPEDVADLLQHAVEHYEWVTKKSDVKSQK